MTAKQNKKLVIVDGNALLHRAWHALPPLTTKDGRVVNAVYGFLLVFFKMWKDLKPTHGVVTFDLKGPTFRDKIYADYKATRVKQPDELYDQLPILKEVLRAMNVSIAEAKGYEADDVIGTLARAAEKDGFSTAVVTGDLDTLQLVDDHTTVVTLKRGLSDTFVYDREAVAERFGLPPERLVEYRGLKGDPSDNIPGVKGIGEKTAAQLIKKYESVENLYIQIKKTKTLTPPLTPRLKEVLLAHEKEAYLSRQLSEIDCNVPLKFSLDEFAVRSPDYDKTVTMFQELQFKTLLAKLPPPSEGEKMTVEKSPQDGHQYEFVETDEQWKKFLKKLAAISSFVLDTETTGLNPFTVELLGMSFSWKKGEAYYVLLDHHPERLAGLKKILEDPHVMKWGHNVKYDMEVVAQAGITLQGIEGDTMLASYVLNPGSRAHDLDTLAFTELGHRMIPITALIGEKKGKQLNMRDVALKDLAEYAAEDADYTWQLKEHFFPELKKNGLLPLFENIEVPLVPVLALMESNGVKIDVAALRESSQQVGKSITTLEQRIYKMAGEEFNVSSPLQLKRILFEKLELSTEGIGKTKTGISTSAMELEKLRGEHKIIDAVLEYRELAKLKSTYLDSLPELVDPKTNRIHTSYNQTVAATGRLSSSDPNLQNIPIRTELGNEVRKAFVAERGFVLLSADYSQIELRIVASLADDKAMIDIFRQGQDIHTATAAKIHGLPEDKVTKAIRSTAKEVNFGVLYGMGAWGLSMRTGISQDAARAFIEKYFETFSGVKKYLEETKAIARSRGFVETLFGRRRYLPEIKSGMPQVRAAAERMAVNMPIQGTAADLMKLAMIKVAKRLTETSPRSKLALQVHDELVVEVPKSESEIVARLLKEEMETVTTLKVPIEVHVSSGASWGAMKPMTL